MAADRILESLFLRSIEAYCLSKALSEDYAKVISKVENSTKAEVLARINKRASELFNEIKEDANRLYQKGQEGK